MSTSKQMANSEKLVEIKEIHIRQQENIIGLMRSLNNTDTDVGPTRHSSNHIFNKYYEDRKNIENEEVNSKLMQTNKYKLNV